MNMTEDDQTSGDQTLSRTQRRLLRRIYNARTVPIVVEGQSFLTYRQARLYLETLSPEARDAAYAVMKEQAK